MAEETKTEERGDAARDAGEKLDMILKHMDSLSKRMDAMEEADQKKADAEEEDEKADEEEDKADAGEIEEGEPKEVAADKKRKDSAEEEAKAEREDAEEDVKEKIADALTPIQKRIADVERALPRQVSDADYAAMADAQAKADRIYQAFNDSAPRPQNGEDLPAYRRRLAHNLKKHSTSLKDANVYAMADEATFDFVEKTIYADAEAAALRPADIPFGHLREVKKADVTGRVSSEFVGDPASWMGQFAGSRQRARITPPTRH